MKQTKQFIVAFMAVGDQLHGKTMEIHAENTEDMLEKLIERLLPDTAGDEGVQAEIDKWREEYGSLTEALSSKALDRDIVAILMWEGVDNGEYVTISF